MLSRCSRQPCHDPPSSKSHRMTSPVSPAPDLSVVIPAFNAEVSLPSTLTALAEAVSTLGRPVEVIVVNDGSSDGTASVAASCAPAFPGRLEVISQPNRGRFAARRRGLESARATRVLFLDSRVLVHANSLAYAFDNTSTDVGPHAWNAHVVLEEHTPLVGRFWDVPTYAFWGRYLRDPRPFDLTSANFDSAPKGTTMFLADRELLVEVFDSVGTRTDSKLVSDDTAVLRVLAGKTAIRLDPRFSATYRPRITTKSFVKHSFDRGTLFVDSYGGTSPSRSIALFAAVIAPLVAVGASLALVGRGKPRAAAGLLTSIAGVGLSPAGVALWNRCPPRSLISYVVNLAVFAGPFWAGLTRGLFIHRHVFNQRTARRRRRDGRNLGT